MTLAKPCRPAWILRAIVQIAALSMFDFRKQAALCHAVALQLIGHDDPWLILKTFQQPPEETPGGFAISTLLYKDIENNAVLINRAPKIMLHTLNTNKHLIEMPLIAWSWPAAAQAVGKAFAKFLAPTPHSLIGYNDAPLSQKQFNVAEAEAERVVQPDSLADDLGREAVAVVRVGWWLHATHFGRSLTSPPDPLTVTMPKLGFST